MRKLLTGLVLSAALLAACGAQAPAAQPTGAPTAAPDAAPTAPPGATAPATAYPQPAEAPGDATAYPAPTAPAGDTDTAHAQLIQLAQGALAKHLGVEPTTLTLTREQRQEWPDSSLGCPAPDVTYAQYTVPGHLLEFSDGAKTYAVHTTTTAVAGEPMVFCDNKQPVDIALTEEGSGMDAAGESMLDKSKQDLAQHLGIDQKDIEVATSAAVDWPDSSLGCPKPDMTYLQVITPGYQFELLAQGQLFRYHTDAQNVVVRCDQP